MRSSILLPLYALLLSTASHASAEAAPGSSHLQTRTFGLLCGFGIGLFCPRPNQAPAPTIVYVPQPVCQSCPLPTWQCNGDGYDGKSTLHPVEFNAI